MNDSADPRKIELLLSAFMEGNADAEMSAHYEQLLANDAEALDAYCDMLNMHAMLEWRFSNPLGTTLLPDGDKHITTATPCNVSFYESMPFAYIFAGVVLMLACVVSSLIDVPHFQSPANKYASNDCSTAASIARITGMFDCNWDGIPDDNEGETRKTQDQYNLIRIPKLNSLVALGDIFSLRSGLLEITYDNGARVILQGPFTYQVDSAGGGYLSFGKLTAYVDQKDLENSRTLAQWIKSSDALESISKSRVLDRAHPIPQTASSTRPFAIRTPTAVVTDLGTEFGVEVERSGTIHTSVFKGLVRIALLNGGGSKELHQNESAVVTNQVIISGPAAKPRQYVRKMPNRTVIEDNYEAPRNYLEKGTSDTVWSGILNANNAARLDTLLDPANETNPSSYLTLGVRENVFVGWEQPRRPQNTKQAPFLFVDIDRGDFESQVEVKNLTACAYSMAGIMVRRDDNNFVSVNMLNFSTDDRRVSIRSEMDGIDDFRDNPAYSDHNIYLRIVRIGNAFLAYSSHDGGKSWNCMTWNNSVEVLQRPDMSDKVQVGLWYGTFNATAGAAVFDNFSIKKRL